MNLFKKKSKYLRYYNAIQNNIIYSFKTNLSLATTYSPLSLVIYSISSGVFTIKNFSGTELDSCTVEPSTGRFVVNGNKSGSGYTSERSMEQ